MNIKKARKICEQFAITHKLIFEDEGECGFGRECVGFISKNGNWLDFCPVTMCGDYQPIAHLQCDAVIPPDDVNNYHKHDCMAVLGRGDNAIIGLACWVEKINAAGNVRVVEYDTGATGMQAVISGTTSFCIMAG